MANEREKIREEGKVARVPFGTVRLKMQLSALEQASFAKRGMTPYWFNDRDGRLERAKAAGYSFVSPENARSLGQSAIHGGNTDEGSKVSMIVGRGDSQLRAFLMEIPTKYWKEDQQAKFDRIDQLEQSDPFEQTGEGEFGYGTGVSRTH